MAEARPVPFAVVLPVGPGEAEIARAGDTLASLFAWEPAVACVVLIDDAPQDRALQQRLGLGDRRVVTLPSPRQGRVRGRLKGLCASMLTAFGWIARHASVRFVLKLDADTLVVGSFADRIADVFAAMPEVGMVGAYDRLCSGEPRDFTPKAVYMRKLARAVSLWRPPLTPGQYVRIGLWGPAAVVRRRVREAFRTGYVAGEHCLGAAYAMSSEAIARIAARGYFDDPLIWLHTHGEDAIVSMHVRAVGLRLHGMVGPGDPFGVRWRGLPDTPERLLASGHALIHSVRNDARFQEEQIREFFRARRPSPAKQHA